MVRVKVDVNELFTTVCDGPVEPSDQTESETNNTKDLVTEQGHVHAHCRSAQYCLASCSVSYEITEQNQIKPGNTQL